MSESLLRAKPGVGPAHRFSPKRPCPICQGHAPLVLDPFSVSGTTGIACRKYGRRFLAWEQDARHAELARERIAGVALSDPSRKQTDLFSMGSPR